MKGLVPVSLSHIAHHREIVESKTDSVTKVCVQSVDSKIAARFTAFEAAVRARTLHAFIEDASLQAIGAALRSCYKSKTKKLYNLLSLIGDTEKNRSLIKCPYCGITLPKTQDHYLPESKYPELAVHGLNLVPCCSTCNEVKGNRWKRESQRFFIHFYSDPIPSDQFLLVTLFSVSSRVALGTKFSIKKPDRVSSAQWSLIENHFNKLDLLSRYEESSAEEIQLAMESCVDHLLEGGKNSSGFLTRIANRLEVIFGNNHWRVVLLRALALDPIFSSMVKAKKKSST